MLTTTAETESSPQISTDNPGIWDLGFVHSVISRHRTERVPEYHQLVTFFKEHADQNSSKNNLEKPQVDTLMSSLMLLQQSVSLLTEEHSTLVNSILRCHWYYGSVEIYEEFCSFMVSLLTVQPIFVDACLRSLVKNIRTLPPDAKINLNTNKFGSLDGNVRLYFDRIHELILRILRMFPLSLAKLIKYLEENCPFKLRPAEEHLIYTYNLIQFHRKLETDRSAVISLLVEHIIKIDADASPEELNDLEVESDDEDDSKKKSQQNWIIEHPTAERLDLILTLVFEYLEELASHHEDDLMRQFYADAQPAFNGLVFKSHGLTHVQFIWFYMAAMRDRIGDDFLRKLWQKTMSPNIPYIFRQYAACYVCSFLARAKFVPIRVVIKLLDQMVAWIHDYIKENDNDASPLEAVKSHKVFYAICQNTFYLLTFRHQELFEQRRGLLWFKALNFEKIISCKLNPFKFCEKVVVELFAAVTRQFSLLYCYTIIERNNRMAIFSGMIDENEEVDLNPLNTFFPFEPYVLKRSKRFITPYFRTYNEPLHDIGLLHEDDQALAYRGLIADSEDSEESRESTENDRVEETLNNGKFIKVSRKRQHSENGT